MRNDSRNLLGRLDRDEFQYRDYQAERDEREASVYTWPLLALIYDATVDQRGAVPRPGQAGAPIDDPADGRPYNPYGGAPRPGSPAPGAPAQDLSSLLNSYSGRR